MTKLTKNPARILRSLIFAAMLFTTTILCIVLFSNSAKANGGNDYVLTVYSCTHWSCASGGSVACPGLTWIPPGC